MINHNFISSKLAIFFSLILTESFYFTLRIHAAMIGDRGESYIALNRFENIDIWVSLISVFVAFFILINLFFFIVKKYNNKFTTIFLILFLTFILANSIKIIFDFSDYAWHFVGSRNVYPIISNSFLKSIFPAVWFLIPYIFSIIIMVILKNNLEKISKFLISYSIVFLFIMVFQLFSLMSLHKDLNPGEIKLINENDKSQRKVLWILFDGFDPALAFSNEENNYEMTNFNKLIKNGFSHNNFYAPAKSTLYSVPSMLIGKNIDSAFWINHRLNILSGQERIPFDFENTIFGRLYNDGFNSAITGFGFHPYCNMISYIKCKVYNEPLKWYDGILNIFQFNRFRAHFSKIGAHRDANPIMVESMLNYIKSDKPTNLLFVHNRIPHLCHACVDGLAGMAERYFDFKYRKKDNYLNLYTDRREAYLINLKLSDSIVGEILNSMDMENYRNKETLVIFSSDHWAKDGYGKFKTRPVYDHNKPYPALFVAKIIGDDNKFDISEPGNGIHVQELVHNFLNKKINTHSDIYDFFQNRKGSKVWMDEDIDFIVEKDF